MNVTKPGADRYRLRLRVLGNEELWWFLLDHPQQCLQEVWNEVKARKATGILSNDSPFRTILDDAATESRTDLHALFFSDSDTTTKYWIVVPS